MKLYHATTQANFNKIVEDGFLRPYGFDRCIFLADNKTSAAMFLALRGEKKIIVFEVDSNVLYEDELTESFDHSQSFFKCRAYMYTDDISLDDVDMIYQYDL